ncbi:hypothetical protein BUALT_Bualt15G0075500 [Buddleja alternifolia]|uniref:Transposase n=1 Tax=Buddleja alternifolia TaxID=168488 RepID=A0AAV6WK27_9LAMI|nr:hypothetical protein BUALT_Bualt15G0075500 [Buddleja alternifolia]
MFDNVFNTVMDVKGKSKDNLNARLDLQSICNRWDLEIKEVNEKYLKPKASYTLSKDQRQIVLKWIKNLRLPDGGASLAFRDLLPESVWNGLTELTSSLEIYASVGDVYQELTSDPACIILDNELDDVAILTDANRQKRRRSMDLNEEELEEEESGNDNDLTSDDTTRGKVKRRLMSDAGCKFHEYVDSFISVVAPRSMLGDMRGWYTDVWPTFSKIPEHVKGYLFERFKEKFSWRAPWTNEQVYAIFKSYCSRAFSSEMMRLRNVKKSRSAPPPPDYMRADIWEALWDTWEDPQFKKLQENNRKNRLSDRDGNGVVKSCSGTISIAHHAHRMETYTKLKEIRSQGSGNTILSPQGSSTFIPEAWAEACGGIKNRHNSYGFGKSNSGSFTFSGTIPSKNTSNLEIEQLKEELQNMKNKQFEMDEKINQLLAITRANHSNLSGHHFLLASTLLRSTLAHLRYTATGSGQYPPPTPGYYPTPPPGYFMTPATQFHVPGNYIAPGQHPPVPTQQSDQLPSPDQRHSQE